MKRNKIKHTNVLQAQEASETNSLIMSDNDGNLVKASGVNFAKDFAAIAEKITAAKGGKLDDSVKALLEMTEVWTPDMVEEKAPKKRTRKKKEEKIEEKTPKKRTRKKKEE